MSDWLADALRKGLSVYPGYLARVGAGDSTSEDILKEALHFRVFLTDGEVGAGHAQGHEEPLGVRSCSSTLRPSES